MSSLKISVATTLLATRSKGRSLQHLGHNARIVDLANLCFAIALLLSIGCKPQVAALPQTPLVQAVELLSKNQLSQAIERCDEAIAAEPHNPVASLTRGQICEAMGDYEAARTAYQRTMVLRPNDRGAAYRLRKLNQRLDEGEAGERARIKEVQLASINRQSTNQTEDWATSKSHPSVYPKANSRPQNEPAPSSSRQTRLGPAQTELQRAIIEGQRLDANAREADRMALMMHQRIAQEETPASADLPAQVVRFDFGLGDVSLTAVNVPSTGRSSRFIQPTEEPVERQRALVSHSPPPQYCPPPLLALPAFSRSGQRAADTAQAPGSTCGDGRDNNGDGTFDRTDPRCWADGVNPETYQRTLDELTPVIPALNNGSPNSSPTELGTPATPAAAVSG